MKTEYETVYLEDCCPTCGQRLPAYLKDLSWMHDLSDLTQARGSKDMRQDLGSMTLMECWGLYQKLKRVERGE